MDKWDYIKEISKASDKYGDLLLELMEENHVSNLQQITEEQAKEFYERRIKNQ